MAINTYSIYDNSRLCLADEQKEIYEKITAAVRSNQGGVFFLNVYMEGHERLLCGELLHQHCDQKVKLY
jgi:hypothetical protein